MMSIPHNIEGLLQQVAIDLTKSHNENARVAEKNVEVQTHKLHDLRRERLENLKQQLRSGTGGGGCIKVFRPVFKVFDLLLKPITALTAGKLNLELTKILDQLKNAKDIKTKLGFDIKNQNLMKLMTGLKDIMNDDLSELNKTQQLKEKDSQRINNILDQIYSSYKANWYT